MLNWTSVTWQRAHSISNNSMKPAQTSRITVLNESGNYIFTLFILNSVSILFQNLPQRNMKRKFNDFLTSTENCWPLSVFLKVRVQIPLQSTVFLLTLAVLENHEGFFTLSIYVYFEWSPTCSPRGRGLHTKFRMEASGQSLWKMMRAWLKSRLLKQIREVPTPFKGTFTYCD